ncbi:lactate utilization protein [Cetobacterium somerae]|uniref:LUD domain-containing protein n=1 Tax=Cetobacterium sp. NK01 TaxID=2993530 RepID=UPI002116078C|nr:LUD domain-containing protein [Cetobacterium sp. NK01]MCQ8212171.1 lactate utilization protein [Cetobacterium sp. NK01]
MDQNMKWFYKIKAENITQTLLSKEYDAILLENLERVKEFLISKISSSDSVVLDQSPFLNSLDLLLPIGKKGCKVFDYKKERQAILADNFIVECDFITENGELIFLDDFASCAATFGPNKIFVIVGVNKIIKNLSEIDKKSKDILTLRNYFNETNDSFSIVHHGRKFPNKYTVIVVPEIIGF